MNEKWQRTGSGKLRLSLIDTTKVFILPDGDRFSWMLVHPNGQTEHGNCATESDAKEAWHSQYQNWILKQWQRGKFDRRSRFFIPFD